ncbi:hypothetical protein [Streptomyces sp. NPDC048527]|uniref:hypothetical protein n=1 Tax=Streptomyces sp. NPDC048527 TaxID=3365568 RepID=UPI003710C9F9
MIPEGADIQVLSHVDDADVGLLPLKMGHFTVHASLSEPWLRAAAARGESSITAFLGFRPGEVEGDFSGYYSVRPSASDPAAHRRRLDQPLQDTDAGGRAAGATGLSSLRGWWRPWPWLPGLDPFLLMVHSYQDRACLVVGGLPGSVTEPVLGSWLRRLSGLSTVVRLVEDPLVLLTCTGSGTHQELADSVGRLVWFPEGTTSLSAGLIVGEDRAVKARVIVGRDGAGSGRFRSVYPQGPTGDRVRWAYRRRFASSATDWLVEHAADLGVEAPAGARPLLFGGSRLRGLAYFDRRDRASRSAALDSSALEPSYVAWTPNHAYQPGAPAQAGQATEAGRPWNTRELGELPFHPDAAAVVVGYFADGRFAVYDERSGLSYWETPLAFGQRLGKDLAAAADGPTWAGLPSRVVLLTDFDAVPARARADVARGIGGPELITVNVPASLFLDEDPGRAPTTRIALLPGNDATTVVPKWTFTTPQGISVPLSREPGVRDSGMQTVEEALRAADLPLTVAPGAADRSEKGSTSAQNGVSGPAQPGPPFDEAVWRERSDALHEHARSSDDLVEAVVEWIQAHLQLGRARGLLDGPGSSLSPQIHAAAERRLAQTHDRLTAAETHFDVCSSRLVVLGLARLADEHDLGSAGHRNVMREAGKLLGRARIVIGTDNKSKHLREAQQQVRELIAEQIRWGNPAKASAAAYGADLFTKNGLAGGALEVGGRNLTEAFRTQCRMIETEVQDAITERERSLAAETARTEEDSAEVVDEVGQAARAQAPHIDRVAAEREIAEMKRQAPAEVLSRQRLYLVELIDGLKQSLAAEQTGAAPGAHLLSRHELDGFNRNLTRVEVKLKKMIVGPTGHRGHHELLERSIGQHPDFGAKLSDARYNNATELARGLSGWVEAKENRHNEKLLAQQIFADGQVEELIDVLLARIWRRLPDLPNADLITSELASGVSSFEPDRRLGQYVPYFHRTTLPPHLEHLEAASWREPDNVLAVLREPTRFDLREKVMVLHDLSDYFGNVRHTPRTHGTGMIPRTSEHVLHSTTEVDARGYRVASSTDRARNPITRPDGTTKNHQPTSDENAAWTILARERRIPVWGGPSATAVRMFKLTDWFGGSRYEIGALAYGVFAFWRLHYDHTTPLAYHTLHEVLDIAQNFGLSYAMNDQTATLGTIAISAAAHEARCLATDLRSDVVPVPLSSTGDQRSDLHALAARLDAERRAADDASTTSEQLEAYARLLSELEHAKNQVGLVATLGPPATRT